MNNETRIKYAQALVQNDSDQADSILRENSQQHIYQYRSGATRNPASNDLYDIENLRNNVLWAAKASTFNDPYDSLIFLNTRDIEFFIPLAKEESNLTEDLSDENIAYVKEHINEHVNYHNRQDRFYVSCFSEDSVSMLMWSHYANYHKGFCVEYDLQNMREKLPPSFPDIIRPVIYDNEALGFKKMNFDQRLSLYPYIKSSEWAYEREWRFATLVEDDLLKQNGLSLNIIGKPTGIYMGYRIDKCPELMEKLTAFCTTEKISLYRMKLDYEQMKLKPVAIS